MRAAKRPTICRGILLSLLRQSGTALGTYARSQGGTRTRISELHKARKSQLRLPSVPAGIAVIAILAVLLACTEATPVPETPPPTSTPAPTAAPMLTETPIPAEVPTERPAAAPTETPAGSPTPEPTPTAAPVVPTPDAPPVAATRREVQELFDIWTEALRTSDAALLHSILAQDLARICDVEEMQPWIEETGPRTPAFQVVSVFLDTEDPDQGMAQLQLLPEEDERRSRQSQAVSLFPIQGFPFPLKREDGAWKAGFPLLQGPGICPYHAHRPPPRDPEYRDDFPKIPGLDFSVWDTPSPDRDRSPGSLDSFTNRGSGGSMNGTYVITASSLMETGLSPAELTERFRENLAHSSWNIRGEGAGAEASWFTWTVHDQDGHLWHGALAALTAGEGWQRVWLSLHSEELR